MLLSLKFLQLELMLYSYTYVSITLQLATSYIYHISILTTDINNIKFVNDMIVQIPLSCGQMYPFTGLE